MVSFRVTLYARWDSKTGQIAELKPDNAQGLVLFTWCSCASLTLLVADPVDAEEDEEMDD
jgi:hypothetical protein